jgi:Ni,Fe-hydrogenase III large subunit
MSFTIPIGPYHPSLEEPFKLEVQCQGEIVQDAALHIQFNFRAVEWLAQKRNYSQGVALVERVCGICSNLHTLTFCRAVEQLAGLVVPMRAQYIRVIIAELERLTSHALWAGVAAEIIGFQTMFMTCFDLRERLMDILEIISGNRVHYAMNCIGGVNRDISNPGEVLDIVKWIRRQIEDKLIPIFATDRTIRARCIGVGVLTKEEAIKWGVVGPTARASGISVDTRCSAPYAAYDQLEFNVPVEASGDVFSRVVVHLLEMVESCCMIEQAFQQMPPGPIRGPEFVEVPPGETVARSEAPRGEAFYYIASDGSDVPMRVKIRTPTLVNMPVVRLMVLGANLADAPLISASIDPCYSCTSR